MDKKNVALLVGIFVTALAIAKPATAQFPIQIDATALSAPQLDLRDINGSFGLFPTNAVQSFNLPAGNYFLQYDPGPTAPAFARVDFVVTGSGTVDFDTGLDNILAGRGTATLLVNGAALQIDATALSFAALGLLPVGAFSTASIFNVTLLPGPHLLLADTGPLVASAKVDFTVTNSGTLDFDLGLDNILSGRGTSTLVVNGAPLQIDATALSFATLGLLPVGQFSTTSIFNVTLLPGPHVLSADTGPLAPASARVDFVVTNSGTVDFNAGVDNILSGRGTATLIVNGATLQINATALSHAALTLLPVGLISTASIFNVTLLPGPYLLTADTGPNVPASSRVDFVVTNAGMLDFAAGVDNILSGRGTASLLVSGAAIQINATDLCEPTFRISGLSANFATTVAQAFHFLPGPHEFVSSDNLRIVFSVLNDATLNYDSALDDIVQGRGTQTLSIFHLGDCPFTDIGAAITAVRSSSAAWGDYDNDGDLDILLTGVTTTGRIARVYQNTGGAFTDIGAGLSGIESSGSAAWGDYDNDGDLDILLAGFSDAGKIARVYQNTGGAFTDIGASLSGVAFPSVAWGDYDNDGDLDILLAGQDVGLIRITKVYRNTGGVFADIGAGLAGAEFGSVAWGDYDNDGDLDILLAGQDAVGSITTRVYKNTGGVFADIGAGLTGVGASFAAWGDYDNDGDLDILLTGSDVGNNLIAKIYQNTGGAFTDIGSAGLTAVNRSSVAWGDYDNDGDLDILLTGFSNVGRISRVYQNTGGAFADIGAGLIGVRIGAAVWGDYDNDGDLDFLLTGIDASNIPVTKIYRNNSVVANTTPAAPAGLSQVVSGNSVALSWNASSDAQTPGAGLTYNLMVGTTSNGIDLNSPMANVSDGYRRVARFGGTNHNESWTLNNLPVGNYFWRVQAVDAAFAGSPFSAEGAFVVLPANLALNKTATASSSRPAHPPGEAVDGSAGTHWRSGVLSAGMNAWWRVDLGAVYNIDNVVLDWSGSFYARQYQVQVSLTAAAGSWETVYTDNAGNGGIDNITFPATDGRYVRIFMTQHNEQVERLNEVEVYAASGSLTKGSEVEASEVAKSEVITDYVLEQNYPNPFNPTTVISFQLSTKSAVELAIYNMNGQLVKRLVAGEMNGGHHSFVWDAKNDRGERVASGVYLYVIIAGEFAAQRKLVLMK